MARNLNNGTLVYVPIAFITGLKYAFRSRVADARRDDLGQVVIPATLTDVTGYVLGANSPKPPRATKLFATGSESSFCDAAKITALKAAGWSIQAAKASRKGVATARSTPFYVTINGIKYAWQSANSAQTPANLLTVSGIKAVAANDNDLVWGAQFPKPSKIKIALADGSKYGTFCDPTAEGTLPADVELKAGKYGATDLTRFATGA
jgi:hypothetical protein